MEVKKGNRRESASWINGAEGDSGITMEYDFHPVRAENIRQAVLGSPGKSLLLTSELDYAVVCRVLEMLSLGKDRAEPFMVKNITFGDTIRGQVF